MQTTSTRVVHDLDAPWPHFLDLLDKDPRRALEGLHVFAWKLFQTRPPSIFGRLDVADREDRISDLVLACYRDDFRKLRSYRNLGMPFAAWLSTVLVRQILDWIRTHRPTDELTDLMGAAHDNPPVLGRLVEERLSRCMDRMSDKCRLYLVCVAEGMKPREITVLLRLPAGENKRVSDDLRHCLRRLRELLIAEGINPEEVLS
jgi:DNA-directed RNA polymerase specialized sigma24 family protein